MIGIGLLAAARWRGSRRGSPRSHAAASAPNAAISRARDVVSSAWVGPPGPSWHSSRYVSGAKPWSTSRPPATRWRMNVSQSRSSCSSRYQEVLRRVWPDQSASRVVLPKPASPMISARRPRAARSSQPLRRAPRQRVRPLQRAAGSWPRGRAAGSPAGSRASRSAATARRDPDQPRPAHALDARAMSTGRTRMGWARSQVPSLGGRRYGLRARSVNRRRLRRRVVGAAAAASAGRSRRWSWACPAWCRPRLNGRLSAAATRRLAAQGRAARGRCQPSYSKPILSSTWYSTISPSSTRARGLHDLDRPDVAHRLGRGGDGLARRVAP